MYGYVKPWWQETYFVPPGAGPEIPLSTQLERAAQLIRAFLWGTDWREKRSARRTRRQRSELILLCWVCHPRSNGLLIFWRRGRGPRSNLSSALESWWQNHQSRRQLPLMSWSPIGTTSNRQPKVAFSRSYDESTERLVVRKGSGLPAGRFEWSPSRLRSRFGLESYPGPVCAKFLAPPSLRLHHNGLEALEAGWIDGFIADEVRITHVGLLPSLEMLEHALGQWQCAVAVARGNPDLLNLVNAVVARDLPAGAPIHGRSIEADPASGPAGSRCHFRSECGVVTRPAEEKEIDLAEEVGEQIFGRRGCVQFELLRMDERVKSLRSWLHFFEPVLRAVSVVGTVLNSNWWHLGMAGKLPEMLCPKECAGRARFCRYRLLLGGGSSRITPDAPTHRRHHEPVR